MRELLMQGNFKTLSDLIVNNFPAPKGVITVEVDSSNLWLEVKESHTIIYIARYHDGTLLWNVNKIHNSNLETPLGYGLDTIQAFQEMLGDYRKWISKN